MEDLAPGIRFYPTEVELISFYLHHKLEGKREDLNRVMELVIPVLDIYEFSPWDLPQLSGEYSQNDPEQWFFFIPRQESEACGGRPKRLTTIGYWKATGSPADIYSSNNRCIGRKRTMVFYKGRVPNGQKTEWKMNEYKAIQGESNPMLRHEFCLCRVYKKSKFLRSFDRRPHGVEIGLMTHQQTHDGSDRATTSYHQNPPFMVEKRSSSESSSSASGDHGCYGPKLGEESNILMDTLNEPLYGWDQLDNWFYGGEDM